MWVGLILDPPKVSRVLICGVTVILMLWMFQNAVKMKSKSTKPIHCLKGDKLRKHFVTLFFCKKTCL